MKHAVDLHSHSIASGHAYSTITEMVTEARNVGLELFGISEHGPYLPGTCHPLYFQNLRAIERSAFPIEVWFGAELNILDHKGSVDLPVSTLKKLDYCIASIHPPCYQKGTVEQNTDAYRWVMENPYVDIIGHPDDSRYPIDYYRLVKAAKETGTILEINNSSIKPGSVRRGAKENYREMLQYCKEFRAPVMVNSDAHFYAAVASHAEAYTILTEVQFPEELILSVSAEKVKKYRKKRI